ncbi:MAG TPA: beta-ketoacyl-ACP synthase III [Anaerolineae bacterium]|nr:beta-ketoacyl-ACP synthase III [Anaerolineae bacterium]
MAMSRNGNGRHAHIVGWGKYVPSKVITNNDLARIVDTSDEWIATRTGIRERRVAGPKDTTASMGLLAAREALEMAGVRPHEVGLIIVATATPEHVFPATACLIQDALGAVQAGAFDLMAGCTGFMYALAVGAQAVQAGAHNIVLVIGSETLSRITDWSDRSTCVLFGDGAGAVVLRASNASGGILSTMCRSDGSGGDLLIVPAGGSKLPASHQTLDQNLHTIKMNGREVFRFAARILDKSTREVAACAGIDIKNLELIIPHQANLRIIQAAARSLKLPEDRFFVNVQHYGNTSSASIPIAICEAVEQGRLKPGDHCVLVGFGAGLTWSAAMVKWGAPEPLHEPTLFERAYARVLFAGAGIRSRVVRSVRRVESTLVGPPPPQRIDKDKTRKTK